MISKLSKEVVWSAQASARYDFLLAGRWIELEERVFAMVVHLHNGGFVATSVAVVGCGENGHNVTVVRPIVAIHD